MIELPEAAEAAREIAAECDFLSVGTNDLTHATLGTDRFAHGEAPAHDPRVLRNIAAAAEAAREAAIPLEVCGEAASDPLTVPLLVGLGADELSVGAARVGPCAPGSARSTTRARANSRARRWPRPTRTPSSGWFGRSRRSAEGRDALAHGREGRVRVFPGRRQAELGPALRSQGEHGEKALGVDLAVA